MEWSFLTQPTPLCLSNNELIATVRVLDTDDGETESGVAVCCSRHVDA